MIRRPPRSTLDRSSAASDVYKRQLLGLGAGGVGEIDGSMFWNHAALPAWHAALREKPVSYTHLRAHETVLDLVCRLLLEKKKRNRDNTDYTTHSQQGTAHSQPK